MPRRLQRARGSAQRFSLLHRLGRFVETEIAGQPRRTRELRIGHLLLAAVCGRIVGQGGKHRGEGLRRSLQFLPAQRGFAFALAPLQCVVQCLLGGRQIDMSGVEAPGTAHTFGRACDIAAPGRRARLLEEVGQRILTPFQRTHLVGREREHLLEQRQRAVRAAIEPLRLQGRFGAAEQGADPRACLVVRAQLLRHRVGFALRHLQLARQGQRCRRGRRVAAFQCSTRLLQCRLAGTGQAGACLQPVVVQRQRCLIGLTCAAAVGQGQAACGQRAIALVEQLLDLRFIPEPVRQRPAQQRQGHEQQHGDQQRPAPDALGVARLHPPPAPLAAHPPQRLVRGIMPVIVPAHAASLAWGT